MNITEKWDPNLIITTDDEIEQDFSKIHLRVIKRNNKKCVTTIEGLEYTNIDLNMKKFLSKLKKELSCNGSFKPEYLLITLQGDQRQKIKQIFIREKIADEKHIIIHGF